MIRRASVALALALPLSVLPVVTASAVTSTTFTYDRVDVGAIGAGEEYQLVYPMSGITEPAEGGFATPDGGFGVVPPVGQQFTAATSFPVTSAPATASVGHVNVDTACPWGTDTIRDVTGAVTVHEATYVDGELTALSLDYDVHCTDRPAGTYAGSFRHNSTRTYVLARSSTAADPVTGVGMPKSFPVQFENVGTATTTPGPAVVTGTYAAEYAVTNDGCNGATLAPAATCVVTLSFTPAALGSRFARVDVPMTGHPRSTGAGALLLGNAVPAPDTPSAFEAWLTANGTHAEWTRPQNLDHYEVLRRATANDPWTVVGTPPVEFFEDETMPRGETAQYAVRAVGPGGTSGVSPIASVARPLTDPAAGTVDALVLDVAGGVPAGMAASGGEVSDSNFSVSAPGVGGSSAASYVRYPPGEHPVAGSRFGISLNGATCSPTTGTVTVDESLFTTQGYAVSYAGSFAVQCFGTTVRGLIRRHSTVPFQAARATQPAGTWRVPAGTNADRIVTVTSLGSLPVTFGAASLTGADAASFQVLTNGCLGQALANGATCDVVVRGTSAGSATRNAVLHLADDTPTGERNVSLALVPTSLSAEPTAFVTNYRVGRALLTWEAPASSGNTPVTSFRVYRQVGAADPVLLADANVLNYTEPRTPGSSQRYGVSAVNDLGEGPVAWGPVAVAPPNELVYTGPAAYGMRTQAVGSRSYDLGVGDVPLTPAVSPDGTRIAYASFNGFGTDLWIRNADGSGTPTSLTASWMPGASAEYDPAFSNDGRYVAFTRETGSSIDVYVVPATGGAPVKRATLAADPAFLADSRTLVVTDMSSEGAPLVRVSPAGARTAIPGTAGGEEPAVSPDGRWLAFSRYEGSLDVYGINVVPVTGGTPKSLYDTTGVADWSEPAWRGDGLALAATHYVIDNDVSRIRLASWNGTALGAAAFVNFDGLPSYSPSWRSVGLALTSPPYVTGATATIGFARTAPYTAATCRLDSGAAVACNGASWTGTGLAAGVHTLVVTATGPGVQSRTLAHTFTVDTAAPVVKVTSPAAPFTLAPSVAFRWTGADATGVASYDVRYRKAPYNGGFGAWTTPAGWAGTTSTQVTLPVTPGWEYCFAVRARDVLGNVSGWSTERCIGSPLDDRALGASAGWSRLTGSYYYKGTYTQATSRGAYLVRSGVQAKRLVLVATRCSTCGSVAVYVGSTFAGNVNLYSPTTQKAYQTVLTLPSLVSGTVSIRVTSTGRLVQVDGLGTRRT